MCRVQLRKRRLIFYQMGGELRGQRDGGGGDASSAMHPDQLGHLPEYWSLCTGGRYLREMRSSLFNSTSGGSHCRISTVVGALRQSVGWQRWELRQCRLLALRILHALRSKRRRWLFPSSHAAGPRRPASDLAGGQGAVDNEKPPVHLKLYHDFALIEEV